MHVEMNILSSLNFSPLKAAAVTSTSTEKTIHVEKVEQQQLASTTYHGRCSLIKQQRRQQQPRLNLPTASNNEQRQKRPFTTLLPSVPLSPPNKISNLQDVCDLIYNQEFLRVIVLFVWLIFGGYVETFLAQSSEIRYESLPSTNKHPLRDLLHDAFPRVDNVQIVNNLLTTTLVYTIVVGIGFHASSWSMRYTILRRWMFVMGCLYIFRGITLLATTLPSSLIDQCRPPEVVLTGSVADRFAFLFSVIGGAAMTCTDNIFSGHTCVMMSCMMVWHIHFGGDLTEATSSKAEDDALVTASEMKRFFKKSINTIVRWILYMVATAGILMILFVRFHYTIDVLLAIYITYTVWHMYLEYVQHAAIAHAFRSQYSTVDLCANLHLNYHKSNEGHAIFSYLAYQPRTCKGKWATNIVKFVDGVDLRWKAKGIQAPLIDSRDTTVELDRVIIDS